MVVSKRDSILANQDKLSSLLTEAEYCNPNEDIRAAPQGGLFKRGGKVEITRGSLPEIVDVNGIGAARNYVRANVSMALRTICICALPH
jgi:hypothetical protein